MSIEQDELNYVLRAWDAVVGFFRGYAQAAYTDLEQVAESFRSLRR